MSSKPWNGALPPETTRLYDAILIRRDDVLGGCTVSTSWVNDDSQPQVVKSAKAGDASQRRLSFVTAQYWWKFRMAEQRANMWEEHASSDNPNPCSLTSSSAVAVAATFCTLGVSALLSGQTAAPVQWLSDDPHDSSGAVELHSESEDEGIFEQCS